MKARKAKDELRTKALAARKEEKVNSKKRRETIMKRAESYLKGESFCTCVRVCA